MPDRQAAHHAALQRSISLRLCRRCGAPTRPCPRCRSTGYVTDGAGRRSCPDCDGWGRLYSPADAFEQLEQAVLEPASGRPDRPVQPPPRDAA